MPKRDLIHVFFAGLHPALKIVNPLGGYVIVYELDRGKCILNDNLRATYFSNQV
jgi:hypothetical protein